MNTIVASDEQVDIYETWENTSKNIVINAVAGSGS